MVTYPSLNLRSPPPRLNAPLSSNDVPASNDRDLALLHNAVGSGNIKEVKILVQLGCAQDTKDNENGLTPLVRAVVASRKDVVELLVQMGADINGVAGNNQRAAPLYNATLEGNSHIVELLLKLGADTEVAGPDGWTSLCAATYRGDAIIAAKLI